MINLVHLLRFLISEFLDITGRSEHHDNNYHNKYKLRCDNNLVLCFSQSQTSCKAVDETLSIPSTPAQRKSRNFNCKNYVSPKKNNISSGP